jgi:hypothetical protein
LEKCFSDTIDEIYEAVEDIADRIQPLDPIRATNVRFMFEHAIDIRNRMECAIREALSETHSINDELLADLKAIAVDLTNDTAGYCRSVRQDQRDH